MSRRVLALVAGGVVLIAVVAVVALTALGGGRGRSLAPEAAAGQVQAVQPNVTLIPAGQRKPIPAIAGETLDGAGLDLASARGSVLVLNFWGSWCGPCRSEQPGLQLAATQLAGRGVRFVGVDVRDQRAAAVAYQREFRTSYPSLFDPSAVLTAKLRDQAPAFQPATLVIDQQGRVGARIIGAVNGGRGSPALQAGLLAEVVAQVRGEAAGSGGGGG
jgi:thiol-disulfide isomerase/thioredoxin